MHKLGGSMNVDILLHEFGKINNTFNSLPQRSVGSDSKHQQLIEE